MAEARRKRAAARGWLTRSSRALEALVVRKADGDVDSAVITDAIDEFDKRVETLDQAQTEVEMAIDEVELEEDIAAAWDFREKCREPRVEAGRLLVKVSRDRLSEHGSVSTTAGSREASLPKLELPSFHGEVTSWQSFWDQFMAIVDSSEMPTVSKFAYLRSLLKGEAKAAIAGLSLTEAHYDIACGILKKRFGRKEKIVFTHIQELMNITVSPGRNKTDQLWKLQDELLAHVRSLEALGVNGGQYGVILTPLILSRLPQDIRLEWAREGEGRESDLEWLLVFLEREIQRRERSQTFKDTNVVQEERRTKVTTVAALQTGSHPLICGLCGKHHLTEKCWDLTRGTVQERHDKLRAARLCFRCLKRGHLAKGCSQSCEKCQGRHHELLCTRDQTHNNDDTRVNSFANQRQRTSRNGNDQESDVSVKPNVSHTGASISNVQSAQVLLQTAKLAVRGGRGVTVNATVLFDSGSDRSYISRCLVDKIQPEWVGSESVSYAAFGCSKPQQSELCNVYQVQLRGRNGACESLFVTEVPVICAPLYQPFVSSAVRQSFDGLDLACDWASEGKEVKIDILIGLDVYWRFIGAGVINSKQGLVAQETIFGWVLSGTLPGTEARRVSHQLLCLNVSDDVVRQLWDLDSIGIKDGLEVIPDPVLSEFKQKVNFVDERYEVALPWKPGGREKVMDNERQARKRLEGLSSKLAKDPDLEQRYEAAISEMEVSGVIHEVPPEEVISPYPTYYLPHRPVVREDRVSTKVRPVFDASAASYNGVSLNDCLHTGPSLIPNLTEILIRFRRWKIALTADVSKAFLQIRVQKSDQDVHRFLWKVKDRVRLMRFARVPFGNRSSPFLLNATIQHHLASFPPSRTIEELRENFYVDDWLSGADTEADACEMFVEATQVMGEAKMSLAKWGSNSEAVSGILEREFGEKYSDVESIKVLGMNWLVPQDCFSYAGIQVTDGLIITKRVVLSFLARTFDPLGLITPFTMYIKCLFQDLWQLGLDWDAEVPQRVERQFYQWMAGLNLLKSWPIPRSYTGRPWGDKVEVMLHAFGDASEKGYGACVYLVVRFEDGTESSSLVMSKARVAPLKRITLPRLELMGALLCARLLTFVRTALGLAADIKSTCWTDSQVVLAWIKADPMRWKLFVANRVSQIHELTSPSIWSFCPGRENPSDLVTRGILAEELVSSKLWLQGPKFLTVGNIRETQVIL